MSVLGKVPSRIQRTAHPKLSIISLLGAVFILLGAVLWLGSSGQSTSSVPLWFQVLVVGYLFVLVGVSGYVAVGVFERRPEP